MRVLLIEDSEEQRRAVESGLTADGFTVYSVDCGEEGVDLGKLYDYDCVVLDMGLPDISGMEVLRRLRACRVATPVLILSGQADTRLKVEALGYGADDYIVKPVTKDELSARINAIVRRSKGHASSAIVIGPIELDTKAKVARVDGEIVHLTGKEYNMLELLMLRKGVTLTKENFLNHLYGGMDEPEIKIIDVFICKLRKKLQAAAGDHFIETVWGRGYVMREQSVEGVAA